MALILQADRSTFPMMVGNTLRPFASHRSQLCFKPKLTYESAQGWRLGEEEVWLPAKDSNLDQQGQNLPSCH